MENSLQTMQPNIADTIAKIVIKNDLSGLSNNEIVIYYRSLCNQLGLNPATNPFSLLTLQGKKILYANRNATDQLMKIHALSSRVISKERVGDILMYEIEVYDKNRSVSNLGAVPVGHLKGDALANAFMKAHTKAMRRAVLSFAGLSLLDETEVETISNAKAEAIDIGPKTALTEEKVKGLENEPQINLPKLEQPNKFQPLPELIAILDELTDKCFDIQDDEVSRPIIEKISKAHNWLKTNAPSTDAQLALLAKLKEEYSL